MRLLILLTLIGFAAPAQTRRIWDSLPIPDSLIHQKIDSLMNKQVFHSGGVANENELGNRFFKDAYGEQLIHSYSKELSVQTGDIDKFSSLVLTIIPKHKKLLFRIIIFFVNPKLKCYSTKGKKNCMIIVIRQNDMVTKEEFYKEAIKLKDILLRDL